MIVCPASIELMQDLEAWAHPTWTKTTSKKAEQFRLRQDVKISIKLFSKNTYFYIFARIDTFRKYLFLHFCTNRYF